MAFMTATGAGKDHNSFACIPKSSHNSAHKPMPTEVFKASRWTSGNHLFRTIIEVSDKAVVRRKRSWFSVDEISIAVHKVASVHVKTGIIWSDILIESSGGSDPMTSHGHSKADARRIKELLEQYQNLPANQDKE